MSSSLGGGGDRFFERRLRVLSIALAAVFGVFTLRLFQLQIVQGERLRERSEANFIRTLRLEAPRGEILDRAGRVLATTRPAFDLEVIPSELRQPDRTLVAVAELVGAPPERLAEKLGKPRGRARFQPVRLVSDLGWERLARIEAHRHALPGVYTAARPLRFYPYGSLAAHVLGTVGEIRAEQLQSERFAGYRPGELVGQSGVEAIAEATLRGRAGGRNVVVDAAGREVELLGEVRPVPGKPVRLSLDLDLQRAAEQALAAAPGAAVPPAGAVVALDPRSGEVLALASAPSFDPNLFARGLDASTWRALREDPLRPLQNRAVSGQYPPGSTFKPIVAAAALASGVQDPDAPLFCPGFFTLGRRSYRCWRKEGHGRVTLHDALVRSCDVYFYQLGLALGIDRIARTARAFGLGEPTGIGLGSEAAGLVPTSEWKQRRFGEPWQPGETLSAAIGQGYDLVTPLQLAVAYAAIANGGRVLRPRLILAEGEQRGVDGSQPALRGRVKLPGEAWQRLRRALRDAVNERGGTGGRARIQTVTVAGKTGTAQVVRRESLEKLGGEEVPAKLRDHAWFAAFAPAEHPEIVVVALVEHGGHGGSSAAPVARAVLEAYFAKRAREATLARD